MHALEEYWKLRWVFDDCYRKYDMSRIWNVLVCDATTITTISIEELNDGRDFFVCECILENKSNTLFFLQ